MEASAVSSFAPMAGPAVKLGRKKIYILPTRHGMAFAGVLAIMLAGAVNYNNSLAYAMTFLLTSLALVSMIHTYRNLAGLIISGRPASDVFAGNAACFRIDLDNPHRLARQGVVLRENLSPDETVVAVEIPANSRQLATIMTTARRRGWQVLDKVTIASRAPFGIFRAWSPLQLELPVLIYPAPTGTQPLPREQSTSRRERGRDGQGREDFSSLREYQPGDSPKRIHWKLATHGEQLPVKLFESASTGNLLLREDDVLTTDKEARLSQLCAWILEAQSLGLEYGLELGGKLTRPGTGAQHQRLCLRRLALYDATVAQAL